MFFYQDGITRFVIGEPGNERFRITLEGISVEWDSLQPVDLTEKVTIEEDNYLSVVGLTREDGGEIIEEFEYVVEFIPFKVIQKSNGILTQVINPGATLYFEDMVSEVGLPNTGDA